MSTGIKVIVDNYKNDDKIVTEIELDVGNVLDLDRTLNGNFEYLHCETWCGPIFKHRAEKHRPLNGVRYEDTLVTGF